MCKSDQAAQAGILLEIAVLTELRHFINTEKSLTIPSRRLIFLGHLVDTIWEAFSVPEDKTLKFITLRDSILCEKWVMLNTLQRLA